MAARGRVSRRRACWRPVARSASTSSQPHRERWGEYAAKPFRLRPVMDNMSCKEGDLVLAVHVSGVNAACRSASRDEDRKGWRLRVRSGGFGVSAVLWIRARAVACACVCFRSFFAVGG